MKSWRLGVWVTAALMIGCASVSPRFSQEVAQSFVTDDMRVMETQSLIVYYPAHARAPVMQTLSRLEACVDALRSQVVSETRRKKLVVLITSAEFNNAFVRAQLVGNPTEMVLPVQMGSEIFNFFDFGVTNIGDVGCHEAVHYVQLEQTDGLWRWVNVIFGDVASPNLTTETWFLEGLATYLEGHLGYEGGRPHSPLWTGMFASGVAAQGGLQTGQLSPAHRKQYPFGGNYLTGSHFVGWLARTYGEDKLWELVDRQGRSIFFPLGVTLRFNAVYGRTIGQLFEQYETSLRLDTVARERPADQQVVAPDLGYFARLSSSPRGELATLSVALDRETHLEVREPDGTLRFSVPVVRIFPERPYIVTGPSAVSGLSFTADGRFLFFLSEEIARDGGSTYEVRQFDAHTGAFVRSWPGLRGLGGQVTPDGSAYVFVAIENAVPQLARLDLATGETEVLTTWDRFDAVGPPAVSPDGSRIAVSRRTDTGWNVFVREPDGAVRQLTSDGRFNYGVRWADADTLVLMREVDGRAQIHHLSTRTGALVQLTDAPWAAFDPAPLPGGAVAFLNRDAWHWSLDRVEGASRTGALRPAPERPTAEGSAESTEATTTAPGASTDGATDATVTGRSASTDSTGRTATSGQGAPSEPGVPSDRAPAPDTAVQPERPAQLDTAARADLLPPVSEEPSRTDVPSAEPREVQVLSDVPYSGLDELFIPRIRIPFLGAWPAADGTLQPYAAFSAQGFDRLGWHNWAINLTYFGFDQEPTLNLQYGTSLLAPWYLRATGTRAVTRFAVYEEGQRQLPENITQIARITDLQGQVVASRQFWTTRVGFGIDARSRTVRSNAGSRPVRLLGPTAGLSWFGGTGNAYAGTRRGVSTDLSVTAYPRAIGSDLNLVDAHATLGAWIPLPLSRRHTLAVSLRGRTVAGSNARLLQVGGVPAGDFGLVLKDTNFPAPERVTLFLPGLTFTEPLRGFDDVAFRAGSVAILSARYRYPFIVDRGVTSVAWLLPSFFLRQLEAEAFFEGARTDERIRPLHGAVGGLVRVRTLWASLVPITLFYQGAWRLDPGLGYQHVIGLTFD